ncbi:MAG: hypothetical protein ABSF67_23340 [Roseiarcus sp.]|jgi:hypothetical protein
MGKNSKPAKKPKLTDAERHKRFLETAEKVEASNAKADFDRAFESVAKKADVRPPKRRA